MENPFSEGRDTPRVFKSPIKKFFQNPDLSFNLDIFKEVSKRELRFIENVKDQSVRKSQEFMSLVRDDLLTDLKRCIDLIYKGTIKLPKTEWLYKLLMQYVALECDAFCYDDYPISLLLEKILFVLGHLLGVEKSNERIIYIILITTSQMFPQTIELCDTYLSNKFGISRNEVSNEKCFLIGELWNNNMYGQPLLGYGSDIDEDIDIVSLNDGREISLVEYCRLIVRQKQKAAAVGSRKKPYQTIYHLSTRGRIIYNNPPKIPCILKTFSLPKEMKEINRTKVDYQNAIYMFILLANGERRLITFSLPKEECHVNEILEEVGIHIKSHTTVAVKELINEEIDIVVAVDFDEEKEIRTHSDTSSVVTDNEEVWMLEEEEPVYIAEKVAVCTNCNVTYDDFHKCMQFCKLPAEITDLNDANEFVDKSIATCNDFKKLPIEAKGNEEPSVVNLTSDDEEDNSKDLGQISKYFQSISKEPIEEKKVQSGEVHQIQSVCTLKTVFLTCKTACIGSYKFTPAEDVTLTTNEIKIKVPLPYDSSTIKTLKIDCNSIVKIQINFYVPVIFIYVLESLGEIVRGALGMHNCDQIYFDPMASLEMHKRIILLPNIFDEKNRLIIKLMFCWPNNILAELDADEAISILFKSTQREVKKEDISVNATSNQNLFVYPTRKGGLQLTVNDYTRLARGQFLNDIIIDFYLNYLVKSLPVEIQEKVHLFSTFFYKRLTGGKSTTDVIEKDDNFGKLQHERVQKWTKNINIFNKHYILIPINENFHWYLSIICFPGMEGPHNLQGEPVKIEGLAKKEKIKTILLGDLTVQIKSHASNNEKDENTYSSDESEFETESEVTVTSSNCSNERKPIQQPCILIFNSLADKSHSNVVKTLRNYLMWEYHCKTGIKKKFDKLLMKGTRPKVPQQSNYTDCGLYLLQYAESFFKKPIVDFHIPITHLKEWFPQIEATKKREDLAELIKNMMVHLNKDVNILPEIHLPTRNGELLECEVEDDKANIKNENDSFSSVNSEGDNSSFFEDNIDSFGYEVSIYEEDLSSFHDDTNSSEDDTCSSTEVDNLIKNINCIKSITKEELSNDKKNQIPKEQSLEVEYPANKKFKSSD